MSELASSRFLWRMVLVAFAWRMFISVLTPIPSEDGVNYLWMAERFAEADVAAGLGEVFPPLWSLSFAPLVWLGIEPFRAAQLAAAIFGALSIVPIARITAAFAPDAVRTAAWFVAFAPLPTRLGAECYTEPMFHLLGALSVACAVRGKHVEAGFWAGFTTWLRPEGILIGVAQAVVRPRMALRILLSSAIPVLALGLWRARATEEPFTLVAKAGFNAERLWGGTPGLGEFVTHWLGNSIQVPWLFCEAFAVVGVLAVIGMFRVRNRDALALAIMTVLGLILVCAFLPRRRFIVSWFFAIVPLAAVALGRMHRARDAVFILAMVANVLLSLRIQDADRLAERVVGEYLAETTTGSERVVGDMTRVLYFAGQRPNPPRHFSPDELVDRARSLRVRFVVLGSRRSKVQAVRRGLEPMGFVEYDLPSEIRSDATRRGILVMERR